ncbi:MAG: DUF805 domain-containing protein [Planctomycetaceae bacterium]|jgi:uncharacterized membrane protein YhaH (DUF805 family)|nr:DUF805 domain-containing protein [Planctomycetaceae bacterium]
MAYYIQIRDKAFGPFDAEQLKEMKNNGKLGKATPVSENKIDWYPAESFEIIFPTTQQTQDTQPNITTTKNIPASISEPVNWYYSYNGVDGFGPVTASSITQMIKSGALKPESVVWQDGQFAHKLNELPQFSELFNTQPTQQNNSICTACNSSLLPSGICPKCGVIANNNTDSNDISYAGVLKKYADFSGRARRREFWNFTIYNMIILPLLLTSVGIIAFFLIVALKVTIDARYVIVVLGAIYLIYNLLIFLPSLAVCIRRLHDTGNSGWMLLIALIPVIGLIILFILLIQDSQAGNNNYGQNPKYKYTEAGMGGRLHP